MTINENICLVAGCSGGHIVPGLTFIKDLKASGDYKNVLFFSAGSELDRSIAKSYENIISSYVPLKLCNFPGLKIYKYPVFIYQFFSSFIASLRSLYRDKPQKVVSMGGYISIPVCLAAWFLKIDIELFELNAVPGNAIKWLAPLSSKIYICFDQAKSYFSKYNVQLVDYPIRFTVKDKLPKEEACKILGINYKKRTLLVLGGSQGSQFINDLILKFIEQYQSALNNVQIIHQTGAAQLDAIREFYKLHSVQALVFDFRNDLNVCYSAADLVIARAGAGTLFELKFFEKTSIIIPLETDKTDHQVDNAKAMAKSYPEIFDLDYQKIIDLDNKAFFEKLFNKFHT